MRPRDFLESNLLAGLGLLDTQTTAEVAAIDGSRDLGPAIGIALAANMKFAASQSTRDLNGVCAPTLIGLQRAIDSAIMNCQFQLGPQQIAAFPVVLNVRV